MANRFYNNSKVNGESFDAADVESIEAGFQGVQDELDVHDSEIDTHVANTSNPHSVTKAQVGLGNVDNTADADKPISTATQAALDDKEASIGAKGTAFNKNFGTGAGTVCQGNDSRLSDSRTPTTHNHAISEVTDLQTTLDGKSSSSHNHDGTYEPVQTTASQAEMEAGSQESVRSMSPLLVAQAIAALSKGVPSGTIIASAGSSVPTGYLECDGTAISRTTYADLFAALGTTYGVGDGATTFNLPDLRGEFIRGYDNGRGVDSGRVFGSAQADELKAHTHTADYTASRTVATGSNFPVGGYSGNTGSTGGAETRPRNVAMMYCIKY